ncbi:MAG: aromatic ring-hydroxylating dioxygenase subunit alpha [Oscillospiraceae bacterium]|nr:aromatic ring-hydroxylating dioxygenase subunit alpha [Oscillospiraceae bacterium]
MIKGRRYAVLSAKQVRGKGPVGATRFSEKLVFWRTERGDICCIADKCCHRGASLSCGCITDGRLACPFHGFQYDPTGKVARIPANGKNTPVPANYAVKSYPAREAHGFIWVWYGEDRPELPEIPFFDDLTEDFSYGEFHENWNVHYTRAIENQLDVVHLPFVHKTTIGRGNKALVNGPVVRWNGDEMTYYVDDVADNGQKPLRPAEITDYEKLYSLQLHMPNLWQNRVSAKLRIMAAFAPVDDENTMIYLRFYQRFLRFPPLRGLVNGMGNIANRVVLHQDRRVVLTQLPRKSELQMGENLVQGDLPIIEFRKKRDALKQRAER